MSQARLEKGLPVGVPLACQRDPGVKHPEPQ